MEILAQIALAGLLIMLVTFVAVVAWCVFEVLYEQFIEWRQRRLARIEAELDQKSERLRSTILGLAEDLAADRADDVTLNQRFNELGIRLGCTSENIDQTPGAILLHGIMSSIAEFYSRHLANEVVKGMSEKVKIGG